MKSVANSGKYPFGKFIISAGIGVLFMNIFALWVIVPIECLIGQDASPYLFVVLFGLSAIAVGFFNDAFTAKVTVPVGCFCWLLNMGVLYLHFSFG